MRTAASPRARYINTDNNARWANASCREEDPELFFPTSYDGTGQLQVEEAKAVCRRCPAVNACQLWAITTRQPDGIWGATTPEERGIVRNNRRRAAA